MRISLTDGKGSFISEKRAPRKRMDQNRTSSSYLPAEASAISSLDDEEKLVEFLASFCSRINR